MDRASKVLRRSGVRLKSIGAGHSDLNMVISELKDLRHATKAFMTAQNSASQDMVKWATCDENRAIQDIMSQLGELNSMWTDVQKDFIEHLKTFKSHFELILEGERQLDIAQNQLVSCEQNEQRIRKELKRAAKKATEEEINNLEIKLSQAERAKYLAQLEVVELAHKTEAIKVVRLKDGLLKLSEAYVELANKCAIIFEAQREVSHYLPDVHSRDMNELKYTGSGACKQAVAKARDRVHTYKRHNYRLVPASSIIEDPPPPYTPGYYNPATGRPYDEATDNRINSQHHPVIQRQRAVANISILPSCPPYPSPSPPHYDETSNAQSTTSTDHITSSDGNNYEDELSGAMGATHIEN
ncbi:uncharacterized protein [Parasteatoda tepidariorum]|uniref:uncharacterized protein isoform X1 n=1 Tax=Parasteatoda tepidariorum TaxID=114398 RepID=UPI00077FB614|nr:uncharacterized protein LOC107437336 [Parasteatoda tepidariorum]XP_015904781.1 uncharacterized protein LOC107437336 [Parasteatoda tepidariorum]